VDVDRAVDAFVQLGATRLGPTRTSGDAGELAILRDPGGAVLALTNARSSPNGPAVRWHLLNTENLERTRAGYGSMFGWRFGARLDLGALGSFEQFHWDPTQSSVGAIVDISTRPGVHPHWLFYFGVDAIEPALTLVRARGGVVHGTFDLPDEGRVAVCDDPQGAAFGLCVP
jgi:predicted enzyme related to lactoylglutathione lyase